MNTNAFDYTGFYTIALTEYNDDCLKTIAKILEDCWTMYITNANVLAPSEDYQTIYLFTYFPFTQEYCERVEPIVYDYFENNTFIFNETVFPAKLTNFFKCPLKISTYNFPPFVILTPQPNGTFYINGIEGTVLRVLSQKLNFTPEIVLSRTNILNKISNTTNASEIKLPLRRSLDLVC